MLVDGEQMSNPLDSVYDAHTGIMSGYSKYWQRLLSILSLTVMVLIIDANVPIPKGTTPDIVSPCQQAASHSDASALASELTAPAPAQMTILVFPAALQTTLLRRCLKNRIAPLLSRCLGTRSILVSRWDCWILVQIHLETLARDITDHGAPVFLSHTEA